MDNNENFFIGDDGHLWLDSDIGGVDLIETSIDWFGLTIGFATSLMGILTAFCGGLLQTGRNE